MRWGDDDHLAARARESLVMVVLSVVTFVLLRRLRLFLGLIQPLLKRDVAADWLIVVISRLLVVIAALISTAWYAGTVSLLLGIHRQALS